LANSNLPFILFSCIQSQSGDATYKNIDIDTKQGARRSRSPNFSFDWLVPWPLRRQAMADVTLSLLNGKQCVAEEVFGWGQFVIELCIHEFRIGFICLNDLSTRHKPKAEEKEPRLLADIHEIREPLCHSESHLRTTLLYANMSAKAVYSALLKKGWSKETCRPRGRFRTF
jgi:hypothetical protein